MSIHIIQGIRVNSDGSDCAALYDFATGLVLATPIFESADEAEDFLAWLQGEECLDLRQADAVAIADAVERFRALRAGRCPSCHVLPDQHHRFSCATGGKQQIVLPVTLDRSGK